MTLTKNNVSGKHLVFFHTTVMEQAVLLVPIRQMSEMTDFFLQMGLVTRRKCLSWIMADTSYSKSETSHLFMWDMRTRSTGKSIFYDWQRFSVQLVEWHYQCLIILFPQCLLDQELNGWFFSCNRIMRINFERQKASLQQGCDMGGV